MRAFRRPGGVPDLAAHGRGAAPAQVARLPPVPQMGRPGQGEGPLDDEGPAAARGYRRDDRRDLRALPPQGDHRDQSPVARDRASRGRGSDRAARPGHPLANIFLLKYGPQAQELQEGVAFHGRAGNALIKSLQRLHVDPMEVYGTNCVKFAGCDLTLAAELAPPRAADRRAEAARRDGRGRARVPERDRVPALDRRSRLRWASCSASRRRSRRSPSPTSTPPSTKPLRRPRFGTPSRPSAPGGPLCRPTRAGALRAARRLLRDVDAPLAGRDLVGRRLARARPDPGRVRARAAGAAAAQRERWLLPAGLAFAVLAAVLTVADVDVFANFARLGATTLLGWWFLGYFEALSWVVLVACIIPWVDAYSVWRGPTKQIVANHAHVFDVLSFAFPVPGRARGREPRRARPALLRAVPRRGGALRAARRARPGSACSSALGVTIALTV